MLRVVFVCVENSNRSQMAEAFARLYGGASVAAFSAGSRPSGRVNPKAIEAMRELGCDLTTHRSKSLGDFAGQVFDVAVTMGCGDVCPVAMARRREDWQVPDPRDLPPEGFRQVRDLIGGEGARAAGPACDRLTAQESVTRRPELTEQSAGVAAELTPFLLANFSTNTRASDSRSFACASSRSRVTSARAARSLAAASARASSAGRFVTAKATAALYDGPPQSNVNPPDMRT